MIAAVIVLAGVVIYQQIRLTWLEDWKRKLIDELLDLSKEEADK